MKTYRFFTFIKKIEKKRHAQYQVLQQWEFVAVRPCYNSKKSISLSPNRIV
jgi:hypothetical protein